MKLISNGALPAELLAEVDRAVIGHMSSDVVSGAAT